MFDLSALYGEFLLSVRGHTPLVPLSDEDYFTLFRRGLRRLYVDTGRPAQFDPAKITFADKSSPIELGHDEQEYLLVAAQSAFYAQMLADLTGGDHIVQHKTDALTVTFSDKATAHITETIRALEAQLADIYHKMPQYAEAMS